jgi:hypothetical protein
MLKSYNACTELYLIRHFDKPDKTFLQIHNYCVKALSRIYPTVIGVGVTHVSGNWGLLGKVGDLRLA